MTLFRSIGRRRPNPEASAFAAYLRGMRLPPAEPMPPRPPEYRPPAQQRAEWWGGRGPRDPDYDPCGSGPLKDGSDEDGEAA